MVDPIFQDVPWEIIYDEYGHAIGEVYTYREPIWDRPRKRRRRKRRCF